MLTKEQRIEEIKIRIKNNEDVYNRLKEKISIYDRSLVVIQDSIMFLKDELKKLEEEELCHQK